MKLALPVLAALLLAGCGEAPDEATEDDTPGFSANGRRNLIGLDADVSGSKASQPYAIYAVQRDRHGSGLAFAEYGCGATCNDIKNGYDRAKARQLTDAQACTGSTWGEVEGCVAFTQGLQPTITRLPPLEPSVRHHSPIN